MAMLQSSVGDGHPDVTTPTVTYVSASSVTQGVPIVLPSLSKISEPPASIQNCDQDM